VLLTATGATLSTTHSSSFPASNCIDGGSSFCHSLSNNDPSPTLVVDYGKPVFIDRIVVLNRDGCCQEQIAGGTISLSNGKVWHRSLIRAQSEDLHVSFAESTLLR
jgi:hypothetical protein